MFKVVKHPLVRLTVVLISLIMLVGLLQSLVSLWQKRDMVSERRHVLQETEAENQKLKQKLAEATSAAFIERQARDKLGFVKEGDTVILMNKPAAPGETGAKTEEQLPNWQRWLRLFF
ncbi:hypothetical protein A2Z00_03775 [Candidatus Gottesmanbacteria bacterium RBG_13_45_10]|uniref:Cell division protein FtsL n=1 Tax=Candidatus Gottesmanbacteria bacterium RBG_13_45_10 TaxID=1798370 RepID=A0A1F5ZH27_9BACT|nr:MAG: hypothetical protein A2Z00_03775 [Candidatus Gottesmanbacteria bacterium RBG_13_45_10]